MSDSKKKKKYPILGIRIDDETNKQLEEEAVRLGGKNNKSAVAKQAIRQWLLFFKPTEFHERMIIYKNVFGFCLDRMDDKDLQDLSELVLKNTFEKNPPNNPNLDRDDFLKQYEQMTPADLIPTFEEMFLEARGVGRGWYTNIDIQYDKEKNTYYLSLTHQVSKAFSKFLYLNLRDMIEGYTFLNVEFFNPYFGDSKITFHIRILGIKN